MNNTKSKKWDAIKSVSSKTYSVKIKKLSYKKKYQFKVAAYTSFGGKKYYGIASNAVTMTTLPKKAQISSISKTGSTSRKIKIKKITGATGYEIFYSTSKLGFFGSTKKVSAKVSTIQMKGLGRGLHYYFKIRAYKKVSGKYYYGAWSKTVKK